MSLAFRAVDLTVHLGQAEISAILLAVVLPLITSNVLSSRVAGNKAIAGVGCLVG